MTEYPDKYFESVKKKSKSNDQYNTKNYMFYVVRELSKYSYHIDTLILTFTYFILFLENSISNRRID